VALTTDWIIHINQCLEVSQGFQASIAQLGDLSLVGSTIKFNFKNNLQEMDGEIEIL